MGALSSGPSLRDEWETQGQPSGQAAVSRYCLEKRNEHCSFTKQDLIAEPSH